MLKILTKIKKVKEIIFKVKVLIIILIVLAVSGWGLVIYLSLGEEAPTMACGERLEKLNSYAVLLDKSMKLARQEQSLDALEMDIHFLNNGTLLAEWENVVFGGNQERDLENYFDVIVDSLKFFSK